MLLVLTRTRIYDEFELLGLLSDTERMAASLQLVLVVGDAYSKIHIFMLELVRRKGYKKIIAFYECMIVLKKNNNASNYIT